MNRKTPLVGITGIIGSGKSTAAQYFRHLGGAVFNSDEAAKKVTEDPTILEIIREKFSDEVIDQNKKLNRSRLAEIVFQDSFQLEKLNNIIHPEVRNQMWGFIAKNQKNQQITMIIIDAPLIYETDLYTHLDFIVVVSASTECCIQRVTKRSNLKRSEILDRMKNQISLSEKISRSDFHIKNEHGLVQLKSQVIQVYQKIISKWSTTINE